jgi:hypothetical protein
MSPEDDQWAARTSRFFGGLFIAVGVLIVVASGLCSFLYVAVSLADPKGEFSPKGLFLLITPLILGGIPLAAGLLFVFLGRSIHRRGSR